MMIRLVAGSVALALAGCAQLSARHELRDVAQAQVGVVDGAIIVTQEPIVVRRVAGDGKAADTVTWNLAARGVLFAARDPVTIDAFVKPLTRDLTPQLRRELAERPMRDTSQVGQIKCATNEARTTASCTLPRELRRGFYAYTIRLQQGDKTLELDPTVMIE